MQVQPLLVAGQVLDHLGLHLVGGVVGVVIIAGPQQARAVEQHAAALGDQPVVAGLLEVAGEVEELHLARRRPRLAPQGLLDLAEALDLLVQERADRSDVDAAPVHHADHVGQECRRAGQGLDLEHHAQVGATGDLAVDRDGVAGIHGLGEGEALALLALGDARQAGHLHQQRRRVIGLGQQERPREQVQPGVGLHTAQAGLAGLAHVAVLTHAQGFLQGVGRRGVGDDGRVEDPGGQRGALVGCHVLVLLGQLTVDEQVPLDPEQVVLPCLQVSVVAFVPGQGAPDPERAHHRVVLEHGDELRRVGAFAQGLGDVVVHVGHEEGEDAPASDRRAARRVPHP